MVQVAQKENRLHTIKQDSYRFKVFFWHDLMVAHLTVEQADQDAVFEFTVEDLVGILNQAGVVYGIKQEQLKRVIENIILNKSIEVARGKSPDKGRDASIELLFDAIKSISPVVREDGYIDYKNLNIIHNATVGQPLARKIHATKGKPGKTVTGEEVEGTMGRDRALPKGKNTDISTGNPDLLIATINGAIIFSNNLVSVEKNYKLNSDVDISTGNIDFVGSLQISGTVKAGFRVKVDGDIEVGKNVEDAEVISGGSVIVKGGFVCSGKGLIKAKKDVFVKFVENQRMEAGNNVNVDGEVINAQIEAGNAVYLRGLKGRKGRIVSGQVTACNLIEVDSIGSEMGTQALVRVGYDKALMKEYTDACTEIKRLQNDRERVGQAMCPLVELEMDDKLNEEQKKSLSRHRSNQAEILKQLEVLENKKEGILNRIRDNKNARIVVKETIYPGSLIQIGMLKKEIMKKLKNCTFLVSRGQIVLISNI